MWCVCARAWVKVGGGWLKQIFYGMWNHDKKRFSQRKVWPANSDFFFLIHFIKKTPILIAEAEVENNGHLTQPSCVQVMLGFVQNVTPKLLCFINNINLLYLPRTTSKQVLIGFLQLNFYKAWLNKKICTIKLTMAMGTLLVYQRRTSRERQKDRWTDIQRDKRN